MFKIRSKGNFSKTEEFFNRVLGKNYLNILDKYGQRGVMLLKNATPVKTGGVASAWKYVVEDNGNGKYTLAFINNAENEGRNIVLLTMYGHGTGGGGYVESNDFVNPVIAPLLVDLLEDLRKEVAR